MTIFLVSAASLVFQVAQTRLLSATLGYHLTYLVISVALLGVGAGATLSAIYDRRPDRPSLPWLAVAVGWSSLAALLVQTQIDPNGLGLALAILSAYVLGSLPFMFASWIVVRSLRERSSLSGRLYAADLAGAGSGSLAAFIATPLIGVPALYATAAVLATLGALAPRPRSGARWLSCIGAVAALVILAGWSDDILPTKVGPHKEPVAGPNVVIEATRWDPHARVDVLRLPGRPAGEAYAFLVDPDHTAARPDALRMVLDLGAATPIVDGRGDLSVLRSTIIAAPYAVRVPSTVLVVGPGGGMDIQNALVHGARRVDAVEINRGVVDYMRGRYASYSGGVYDDPRVSVFEDEARSFIRRSDEQYDLLVMTVVDSYTALASGAYALTESYLYTDEAFADYVARLTDRGVLAVGRWFHGDPPIEIIRTAQLAASGLRAYGATDPLRHIAVLRYRNFGLLLAGRSAFDPADVAAIRAFANEHGFAVAYDPLRPEEAFAAAMRSGDAPATDDRPFFFATDPSQGTVPVAYAILFVALLPALALSYGAILAPLRRMHGSLIGGRAAGALTLQALGVGLGFIGAELVLLQRLTLYLGQPALALAVGLAALLIGAALGSFVSGRWPIGVARAALLAAVLLPAALAGLAWASDITLAWPQPARLAVATLGSAAAGLPLGMLFPQIVVRAAALDPALVPWVWGMNGAATVVGAILVTAMAMTTGFTAVGLAAAACYALVALIAARADQQADAKVRSAIIGSGR